MKVNASKIKALRQQKLWSQEEMAIASGLGLRTVQRLEASGKCSRETLKSIASALGVSAESLLINEGVEHDYFNIQLGYTILFAVLVGAVFIVWQFSIEKIPLYPFIAIMIILGCVTSLFGSLTVKVNNTRLEWYFGLGFWRKKLQLDLIDEVHQVTNKGWWGWGIRYYGQGWLYSVSGLRAVEVFLKDGSRLRVGTDEPEKLVNALRLRL